ncbi:MAG: hypothetical protein IKN49_06640 [Elusimicrobiaceae bacterium]|nr:hypothetical protein [Elusimicrobiaceae bacterium]
MALYYITFGTIEQFDDMQLGVIPAANQKIDYVINKLNDLQKNFHVISLAKTERKYMRFYKGKTVSCTPHGKYTVWNTFGNPNLVFRIIHRVYRLYQLYRFLSSLSSEDVVIVYHSLFYAELVYKLHKKKKFKLILEVEEVYQDIVKCSKRTALYENKIIQSADGYILVADTLISKIPNDKPYIIFNGTYHAEPVIDAPAEDGKIHCVYAGNCSPIQGCASAAVSSAEFLPSNYHVHILGVGPDKEIKLIKEQINKMQSKISCTLTFDGFKTGKDFLQFLQSCHIGLNPQDPAGSYVNTSFHSKILVYLANGLRVVSGNIPTVKQSAIGDLLAYYDHQTPQEIARAIMSVDVTKPYDSRARLQQLDQKFQQDLKQLLEYFTHEKTN